VGDTSRSRFGTDVARRARAVAVPREVLEIGVAEATKRVVLIKSLAQGRARVDRPPQDRAEAELPRHGVCKRRLAGPRRPGHQERPAEVEGRVDQLDLLRVRPVRLPPALADSVEAAPGRWRGNAEDPVMGLIAAEENLPVVHGPSPPTPLGP